MNRPPIWPSFTEYGAFQKKPNLMAYIFVFMPMFAYKEVRSFSCASLTVSRTKFCLSLHLEVGTKDVSKSIPQPGDPSNS